MATNYIQEGRILTVLAPAAVSSGDGVQVGQIFGVAQRDAANGAEVEIDTMGVYDINKLSTQVWAVGDNVYWDGSEATTVATANLLIGVAMEIRTNPTTTGNSRWMPIIYTSNT